MTEAPLGRKGPNPILSVKLKEFVGPQEHGKLNPRKQHDGRYLLLGLSPSPRIFCISFIHLILRERA